MTTIKERKKKQTQTISNSNFKTLNGTESLVRGTTNQHKEFGIHQHLGSQKLNLVLFPIFCCEKRF